MKIGLITTLDTNIGDDFIREGICNLLREIYNKEQLEFICINKHMPYTVYPPWHPIHLGTVANLLPAGRYLLRSAADTLFARIGFSRFETCNLIVQCGAPVFWPNCSHSEWAKPLWRDVIGRLCDKIPVMNLAAGSCYPWERRRELMHSREDAEYIKSILDYCCLTTVRDSLAQAICSSLGGNTSLIPCTAFLAAIGRRAEPVRAKYILLNYMYGGGHYEWDQKIDPGEWERTIRTFISRIKGHHEIAFLCHNDKEYELAEKLETSSHIFFPKTSNEYFDCITSAKLGICNRMHASVGMAGLGIPSIAICTDTRMMMVAELGLPIYYVKELNAAMLEEETEAMLTKLKYENERLIELQTATWNNYISAIDTALNKL